MKQKERAKKENTLRSHGICHLSRNKCIKENLVLSLRTDIRYHQTESAKKNQTHDHVSYLKAKLEENGKSLEVYFKEVKDQMKDFVAQVEWFEQEIDKYNTEKRQIIASNEAILKQKNAEQSELRHQYEVMNSKLEIQLRQISELEAKQEKLRATKANDKKEHLEDEARAKTRYDDLYGQYRVLLGKYQEYEEEAESNNNEVLMANRMQVTKGAMSKDEMQIKLTEITIRNNLLLQESESLSAKILTASKKPQLPMEDSSQVKPANPRRTSSYLTSNTQPNTTVYTTHK